MTVPAAPPPKPDSAPRRRRPVLVELAAALLIVGGALNLLTSIEVIAALAQEGSSIGGLSVVAVALAVVTLALGLLVRYGHAWLVTINVVAVVAFLELISATPVGLLFGGIDTFIVLALVRERSWFATPEPEPESESDVGAGGG